MPTFIKTGVWKTQEIGFKGWLDLDALMKSSGIGSTIYTANGSILGNRTIDLNNNSLSVINGSVTLFDINSTNKTASLGDINLSQKGVYINLNNDGVGSADLSCGGGIINIGDIDNLGNKSKIFLDDSNRLLALYFGNNRYLYLDRIGQVYSIGDYDVSDNGTKITIYDFINEIQFESLAGKYTFGHIKNFTDNAAALTGGLTAGMIYRNGDLLQIVH